MVEVGGGGGGGSAARKCFVTHCTYFGNATVLVDVCSHSLSAYRQCWMRMSCAASIAGYV